MPHTLCCQAVGDRIEDAEGRGRVPVKLNADFVRVGLGAHDVAADFRVRNLDPLVPRQVWRARGDDVIHRHMRQFEGFREVDNPREAIGVLFANRRIRVDVQTGIAEVCDAPGRFGERPFSLS